MELLVLFKRQELGTTIFQFWPLGTLNPGGLDFTEVLSRKPLISLGLRLFDLPRSDLNRGVSDS